MSTVGGEEEGEEVNEHSGGKKRVRRWTSTVGGGGAYLWGHCGTYIILDMYLVIHS